MSNQMLSEVRSRIEHYLDAVDDRLRAAGVAREPRRAIEDDLETQIVDSLSGLEREPTLNEVETILARLDPPEAYHAAATREALAGKGAVRRTRFSPAARVGLYYLAAALLVIVLVECVTPQLLPGISPATGSHARKLPTPVLRIWFTIATNAMVFLPLLLLAASISGWRAIWQIGKSGGALRGLTWAATEALLLPLGIGWLSIVTFTMAVYGGKETSLIEIAGLAVMGLSLGLGMTVGLIFLLLRVARGKWPLGWPGDARLVA